MASKIDIKRKQKDDNKRKISIDEYKRKQIDNVGPGEGLKRLAIPQPPDACYEFGDAVTSKKAKKSGSSKKSSSKLNCANNSFTSSFSSSTMLSCSNNLSTTPATLSSLTMPSPKNIPCPLAASPCDSGLGSIASSPVRAQTTPINTHNLPNFSPPPVPLPIVIPLERTNNLLLDKTKKQRIPTSISDPRCSKYENSINPGKPSVHTSSALKNKKETNIKLKKLKIPVFANSRQVKQLFLRIRQSHQLNNQNEVDPLFTDPIYAFPVTAVSTDINTTITDKKKGCLAKN